MIEAGNKYVKEIAIGVNQEGTPVFIIYWNDGTSTLSDTGEKIILEE